MSQKYIIEQSKPVDPTELKKLVPCYGGNHEGCGGIGCECDCGHVKPQHEVA